MKQKAILWIYENLTLLEDLLTFTIVVTLGIFLKIYREIQKGKKLRLKWFIAEAIISFFVAFSVWAIFDQFLEMNKMFTYVICAWAGSLSTVFHKKMEDLVEWIFEAVKIWISKKLGTNENKN